MIPEFIAQRMNMGLLYTPDNPIGIVKKRLCRSLSTFKLLERLDPIVDKEDNFDLLKLQGWYTGRSQHKSFYTSESTLLRTSLAAHLSLVHYQYTENRVKNVAFCGEVYNNSPIDPVKYPITHQMALFSIVDSTSDGFPKITQAEMKKKIRTLMNDILSEDNSLTYSFDTDSYPYDYPYLTDFNNLYINVNKSDPINQRISSSLNVKIGCGGKLKPDVMEGLGSSLKNKRAWFFALNLDRLAMLLCDIKDIRLLWSCDTRFTDQFKSGLLKKFHGFSNDKLHNMFVPLETIGTSIPLGTEHIEERICGIVRETCGDMVEEVFKTNRSPVWIGSSRRDYFNVRFRCIHKELSDEEVDYMKKNLKKNIEKAGFAFSETA